MPLRGALTGDNHHLATVLVVKAMLAFSDKHVSCDVGNILLPL